VGLAKYGKAAAFHSAARPELPDPAYAAIVVQTADDAVRDALKTKLRTMAARACFPEARVHVTQFVFSYRRSTRSGSGCRARRGRSKTAS